MENFACWNPEEAIDIINPDVDAQPDYIFRAIHTSFPIQIRTVNSLDPVIVSMEKLLERFLAPRDIALVPIIGQSGTGKSHLVRWMNLKLAESRDSEIIFVPKAQTNLRDIVKTLIARLP